MPLSSINSGRVSSEDVKHVCSCKTRSQREHIFKNFNCLTREWAKWVSKPVNGASEWSKHSEAERCEGSHQSERCEWTNVASNRLACSKRDCLGLETTSKGWRHWLFVKKRIFYSSKSERRTRSGVCQYRPVRLVNTDMGGSSILTRKAR